MTYRALLFDLDGTLVDSLPGIEFSVDVALAECGLPPRSGSLRPLIGPPIREIFGALSPASSPGQLACLEQSFRRSYDSEGWTKTVLAPSARETLGALRDVELPLFVVTNKPAAVTAQILAGLHVREFFADVVCRDSEDPPFPSKAEMLRHALFTHFLNAESCLYVGDTAEDYRAAREVGLPIALVASGYGDPAASVPESIHLASLTELLPLLEVMETS